MRKNIYNYFLKRQNLNKNVVEPDYKNLFGVEKMYIKYRVLGSSNPKATRYKNLF